MFNILTPNSVTQSCFNARITSRLLLLCNRICYCQNCHSVSTANVHSRLSNQNCSLLYEQTDVITFFFLFINACSKICVERPLSKNRNFGFQAPGGAFHNTSPFIKLLVVIKIFFCLFLSGRHRFYRTYNDAIQYVFANWNIHVGRKQREQRVKMTLI